MIYDVVIIGGGINGAGIAADAASRGLRVLLVEQNDLGSATSSASSKLVHGGLRYLEQFEIKLVKEALRERDTLLKNAPHLVKPLPFIIPCRKQQRSPLLIRLGLLVYDFLARSSYLPRSHKMNKHDTLKSPLKNSKMTLFKYWDCRVDDARLVITNALAAKSYGAEILTYTKFLEATRDTHNKWQILLYDKATTTTTTVQAKALINATGPWVSDFLENKVKILSKHKAALVKGSHIIIPKFYDEDVAYLLPTADKRVVFIIPYLSRFSLIGTTEIRYKDNLEKVAISAQEISYLIQIVQDYFSVDLKLSDIIHTYSGVRPLLADENDNPTKITRDYVIEMSTQKSQTPLISIFGGKLTTYRMLAQKVVDTLKVCFPNLPSSQTATLSLPGGDYTEGNAFLPHLRSNYSWVPEHILSRYFDQYGTRTTQLLKNCNQIEDLGKDFGAGLYERELTYLIENEWAKCIEDILWRRTKLGYFFPKKNVPDLSDAIEKQLCRA